MIKLLLASIIGILILAVGSVHPQSTMPLTGAGASKSSATCNTSRDSSTGTTQAGNPTGSGTATTYTGSHTYSAGASYTACKITMRAAKTGSPTFTAQACIYTDNAGNPGTLVGTCSDTVSVSALGTTEQDMVFVNLSASVTSGTSYHVVVQAIGSPNNGTDYFLLYDVSAAGGNNVVNSTDGITWANADTFSRLKFTVFSS